MNTRHLGVEIEFTGIKRENLVKALENLFQTEAVEKISTTTDDKYRYHQILDTDGNKWVIKRDRSIKPQAYAYNIEALSHYKNKFEVIDLLPIDSECMVELVSPVLTSSTLPTLFTIVDVIKSLGGLVNSSCGIHVHIDKMELDDCVSLFKRFVSEQDGILESFNVASNRLEKYCKRYNPIIPLKEFLSINDFMDYLWCHYRSSDDDSQTTVKSRSLRYYALNFYSLYTHGTIEYRLFNSTLDKAEIAKILKWVLDFSYPYNKCLEYNAVLEGILLSEISA